VAIARLPGAEDLPLPRYATAAAAGLDIAAAVEDELVIQPGERSAVPTGFRIAVPEGFEAQVRPRSGLALHRGVVLPNAPGTIDPDYRGEVQVLLLNAGREPFVVRRGDRIAQLVVAPVARIEWEEVEALEATSRGEGGFGHTERGEGGCGHTDLGSSGRLRGPRLES
jgi:dUTP pyrophosphatase